MRIRVHYDRLGPAQRSAFVQALLALKDDGRYDAYVEIYRRGAQWARGGPAFLPWHRHLLLRFEEDLRTIEPDLALPYWDFVRDRSTQSTLWDEDLMGGDGRPDDGMVLTGPFATEAGAWPLASGGVLVRRLGHDAVASTLPTAEDLRAVLADPHYDAAPWSAASPAGFRNRLEGWVRGPAMHNRVHAWVGGVMARDDAADDPLFWLVHAFLDKVWSQWQRLHPGAQYVPQGEGPPGHNLEDTLWPWNGGEVPEVVAPYGETPSNVTPRDLLDHRALGYVYDTDEVAPTHVATTMAVGEEPTLAFGEEVPARMTTDDAPTPTPMGPLGPATTASMHPPEGPERTPGDGGGPRPPGPAGMHTGAEPDGGRPPRPTHHGAGAEAPPRNRVGARRYTTAAVGEEGPGPTTMAMGEEGPSPTTMAMGEEGPGYTTQMMGEEGPGPTTMAIGEEGPSPWPTTMAMGEEGPGYTTQMVGEEGPAPTTAMWGEEDYPPTTMAIGEEDRYAAPRPDARGMTTLAVGEEDGGTMTTLAVGEEDGGGTMTTLAVGEEDGGAATKQAPGEDRGDASSSSGDAPDDETSSGEDEGGPFGTY